MVWERQLPIRRRAQVRSSSRTQSLVWEAEEELVEEEAGEEAMGTWSWRAVLCPRRSTGPTPQELFFTLLRAENPGYPLQEVTGREGRFFLPSVKAKDAGSYSCFYSEKRSPERRSETSESLDLVVTGKKLIRPSLTVEPSSSVSLGEKVTFWCQAASCGIRFTLHKEGEDMPVDTINSTQDKARFLIPRVTSKHSGSYSCLHHPGEDIPTPARRSEPLELSVYGESDEPFPEKGSTRPSYTVNNFICISLAALVLAVISMVLS
ncbi:immunoglobulin superfamily member 1-like [Gracilinanus agilis]|uniref:immunoglobulin superfamily member 1-like n=1 Tax=Gracilinanus agilis TaxID=191870 RepID=UPI001CFD02A5|nr:immunoglobulin superfamily member 1-like [Gracilinanus agilis]